MKYRNGFFGRGTLAFIPPAQPEDNVAVPKPRLQKSAVVTIRYGDETLRFSARRFDSRLFCVRGRLRTAKWCGSVVAVALDGLLP